MSVHLEKAAFEIQRRLASHVRNKTTDRVEAARLYDIEEYVSDDWFRLEQEKIFYDLPLLVGMSSDVPMPGDKMVFDAAGPSILIVRDENARIRAFLNMCTHRGARLVRECRRSRRITCNFHGWTFDTMGRLVGQPGAGGFEGLARDTLGLLTVPAQEWNGMIFVRAKASEPDDIDVGHYLGGFAEDLAALPFGQATLVKRSNIEVKANWKYVYDTFGETYHFASLHPSTVGAIAHHDVVAHDRFGPHQRLAVPYLEEDKYVHLPEDEWPRRPYGGVHLLFPNTVISIGSLGADKLISVFRQFPMDGPHATLSIVDTYSSASSTDIDLEPWIKSHDFLGDVLRNEDYSVSAGGQYNLRYAPKDFRLKFGNNEGALQHFHQSIHDIVRA